MITIYTIAYNEEVLIKFMIDHYRSRFPDCKIVVYDNMSTDNTVKIALANKCSVIPYYSNKQIQDQILLEIKNNCWKTATTNWVLVCDVDELLNINEKELKHEELLGTTIIKSQAFNMINMEDNFDLANIRHGVPCPLYDKKLIFNKKFIVEINYDIGCHVCNPIGKVVESNKTYQLYHYKYINIRYHIERVALFYSRLSKFNLKHKIGMQYHLSPQHIKYEYFNLRKQAIKLF